MARFLIRRLLALIPVLLVVAIVTFTLIHMMPGDAAAVMLGPNATEEQVAQLRASLGLDQPLVVQFFAWLGNILTGDLGESVFIHRPVAEILATALAPTVNLALLAEIIAIVVGVPAGIMAARHAGAIRDKSFMTGAMIGISMPSFLIGLLLMLIFAVLLGWFPVAGYRALEDGPHGDPAVPGCCRPSHWG
jgi:peptide/nickel transport system permease protein